MNAEDILVVGGTVVVLVQLVKWGGLPARLGPLAVVALSLIGVLIWGYSEGTYSRPQTFEYFAGWAAIAATAAGVYGFVRETPAVVTSLRKEE